MGFEGDVRFEELFKRRPNAEDPYGRGIEAHGNQRIEGDTERESPSWLSGIIDPLKVERYRQYPALEGHSTEWIIMEALLGKLVEQGVEMDPILRVRLRNLVGVLRSAFYPNMTASEQDFIRDLLTRTTTVDFSKLQYDVTSEVREDSRWLWRTFVLVIPSRNQLEGLPEVIETTVTQLDLKQDLPEDNSDCSRL